VSSSLLEQKSINFLGQLEKTVADKIGVKDYFNTLSGAKILWALSKFYNRHLAPTLDSCDAIM